MGKKYLLPLLLMALVVGGFSIAYAVSSYLNSFVATYPGASSTQLNSCLLCHPSGNSSQNSYCVAYRNAGHNYAAIESLDSDGDGFNNLTEIQAGTFPGNSNSYPSAGDTTRPTVTNFTTPSSSTSLTVTITSFTATDNVGVTGYLVTETSATPSATASGWTTTAPTSYTFTSAGSKTLYAWAKDAAGNVSLSSTANVTITLAVQDTTRPTVTNFTIPSSSTSLTVTITSFTATDNVGVTGYLVTETSATPSATATGWSTTVPTSYTFTTAGSKTLYAWAKDAAGNISLSRSANVTVTAPSVSQGGKIFTAARSGEYYGDPARWVSAGYNVRVWDRNVEIKAQAVDANGKKIAGAFQHSITSTGEFGILDMIDAQNLAYQKSLFLPLGENHAYTVSLNGSTSNGTIYSSAAKCDTCHQRPPGHIANQSTWGKCGTCHNLSNVTHKHAFKFGTTFQCYSCHSSDTSNSADVHSTAINSLGYAGLTCVTCHGDLSETQNNTFNTEAMAGLPSCTSCHDNNHGKPVAGVSFSDSVGHGGMLCISCHGSPHKIQKPVNLGTNGVNNCSGCHSNVTHGSPSCGQCHGSSWDPHLVPGASPTQDSGGDRDDDDDDHDHHDGDDD